MPGERFIIGASERTPEEENSIFGETCQDINGRTIAGGNHYVPGPDSCTVCLCDEGRPKWCQAVLCAAPKVSTGSLSVFLLIFIIVNQVVEYNGLVPANEELCVAFQILLGN